MTPGQRDAEVDTARAALAEHLRDVSMGEPVAWMCTRQHAGGWSENDFSDYQRDVSNVPLYRHPKDQKNMNIDNFNGIDPRNADPAYQSLWTKVQDGMPVPGKTVLACYKNSAGNLRRIRACWTPAKSVEANTEYDFGDYDEDTDTYWTPEGWYEQIDNWDDYSAVHVCEGNVTHWMPMPDGPTS